MHRFLWVGAFIACGSDPKVLPDAFYPHDGFPASFALTSPTLPDGARFPDMHTCAGANTSPQLDWTGAPAATQSFAVVLVNSSYFDQAHWMIYDIPATATHLPAGVERAYAPANLAPAHQTTSYDPSVFGYLGPCTQYDDTYQFVLMALDVATLPALTSSTTIDDAIRMAEPHKLGQTGLLGTSSP